jgi:hypothetical protein
MVYIITVNGALSHNKKTSLTTHHESEKKMSEGIKQNHIDGLAIMPEDELNRNLRQAQETLGKLRREGASSGLRRYAEEEVCYLQREVIHRYDRRQAHDAWLGRVRMHGEHGTR